MTAHGKIACAFFGNQECCVYLWPELDFWVGVGGGGSLNTTKMYVTKNYSGVLMLVQQQHFQLLLCCSWINCGLLEEMLISSIL